jgi:hypothetical protein
MKILKILQRTPMMFVCWAVISVLGFYLAFMPPEELIIRFGIGDALVYPRVAFNIATGKGSTYNLIVPTNGYHPLWLWLHIPFMVGAETIMSRMWIVEKLWIITALSAIVAWSTLIWRFTKSDLAAGFTALIFGAFGWSLYVLYSGIETPLVLLCLAITFHFAKRLQETKNPSRSAPLIAYACAVALTFLARLDSIMILLPTLWMIYPVLLRTKLSAIFVAFAVFGGLIAPYFAWNIATFGHFMPVSGVVKTVSDMSVSRSLSMLSGWALRMAQIGVSSAMLYIIALGVGLITLLLLWTLRDESPALARMLGVCLAGAMAHYGYYLVFMREINVPWHTYPQFLTAYLLSVSILVLSERKLSHIIRNYSVYRLACIGFFVFLVIGAAVVTVKYHSAKQVRHPESAVAFEVGKWIRDNLPTTAKIAMYDSFIPAAVASQQSFVDLNGLVEDLEGALLARQGKIIPLIQLRGCEYLVEKEIANENSLSAKESEYGNVLSIFSGITKTSKFQYKVVLLNHSIIKFFYPR